jgi:hypothetical protein
MLEAAHSGHEAVLRLLLELFKDASYIVLNRAVAAGHEAVVRLLLEPGKTRDFDQRRLLQTLELAFYDKNKVAVRLLLELAKVKGVNSSELSRTLEETLEEAAEGGSEVEVQLLIELANIQDFESPVLERALKSAVVGKHEAVMKLLQDTIAAKNIRADAPRPTIPPSTPLLR